MQRSSEREPRDEAVAPGGEDKTQLTPAWLATRLFQPVDAASLALFRMMFGAILFWEVWRFFGNDWIRRYYIDTGFHFKYFGFTWVQPWPGDWMYVHFAAVAVFALCVMLGLFYRISALLLFLGFTYWFLLDQARYLNHFYLTSLLCFLMIFVPAHCARSLDAIRRPEIRSATVPAWSLWLLRAQMGIVYFYAGLGKINYDWLRGEPIRDWLMARSDIPLIGTLISQEWSVWIFAYGGLLFDLLVVPALLWRRTRPFAFAAAVVFHMTNKMLFSIGMFPILALAATLLFLSPSWPRALGLFFAPRQGDAETNHKPPLPPVWKRRVILGFVAAYLSVQILVPLRHFLYPGSVHWNEEGHRFSWHMKLRDKDARARFYIVDPETGHRQRIRQSQYLNSRQRRKVSSRPDLALQFAHFVREDIREEGFYHDVEIRVEALVSLNGRRPQLMIDPEVDLASQPRTLGHADWILPLNEPLRR